MPGSACSSAHDERRQDHRTTTTERHAIRRFGAGWFSYVMTRRIKEENMIYLNDKKIAVIGIDHGYGNIKTANTITPTAITEYDSPL